MPDGSEPQGWSGPQIEALDEMWHLGESGASGGALQDALRRSVRDEHPEAAGVRQLESLQGVKAVTSAQYSRHFDVLVRYCERQRPAWNPYAFSERMALFFASFMLRRRHRGRRLQRIDAYFSAFNAMYRAKDGTEPWAGPGIAALKKAFADAQILAAKEAGDQLASLRVAFPAPLIWIMLLAAEDCADGADRGWWACFFIMLLFGFRSDTISGLDPQRRPSDLCFSADGSLNAVVNRVKRGRAHIAPFTLSVPPASPRGHVRSRVFAVIEAGIKHLGPQLWGTAPARVSDAISGAMNRLMADDIQSTLPTGTFVSSHSFRKAGASILYCMRVSTFAIRVWGGWRTITSPALYCDPAYSLSPQIQQLFDWQLPVASAWGSWQGYDEGDGSDEEGDTSSAAAEITLALADR